LRGKTSSGSIGVSREKFTGGGGRLNHFYLTAFGLFCFSFGVKAISIIHRFIDEGVVTIGDLTVSVILGFVAALFFVVLTNEEKNSGEIS